MSWGSREVKNRASERLRGLHGAAKPEPWQCTSVNKLHKLRLGYFTGVCVRVAPGLCDSPMLGPWSCAKDRKVLFSIACCRGGATFSHLTQQQQARHWEQIKTIAPYHAHLPSGRVWPAPVSSQFLLPARPLSQTESWRSASPPSQLPTELGFPLLTPPSKADTSCRCSGI